jgi:Uma2 family endonuclease
MEELIPKPGRHTVEEYLRFEQGAAEKHEYYQGEIVAMAGESAEHALITVNLSREISARLKGKPCRAYSGDLRVQIPRTPLYVYPDLSVVCGQLEYDQQDTSRQTITNPKLIMEVLSPSTQMRDRGEKLSQYLQIPTLEEYVLVEQKEATIQTFYRQSGGQWLFTPVTGVGSVVKLRSLDIELPLAEVYAGVEFPPIV